MLKIPIIIASAIVLLLIISPVAVIFVSWLDPQPQIWEHFIAHRLGEWVANSFILIVGVGSGVVFIGVAFATLVTYYDFPLRRYLDWMLVLPLAMPAYVFAFAVIGMFDFGSPLQLWLVQWWGIDGFDIRTTPVVIVVLTGAFYPYVYLLTRSALLSQEHAIVESAHTLGCSPLRTYLRVNLPLARPAIVAGLALALMETLADFGAVSAFNFATLTTAIYQSWFGFFNLSVAAQLASLLLLFIALFLIAERTSRQHIPFASAQRDIHPPRPHRLRGIKAAGASFCTALPVVLFFILPVIQIFFWAISGASSVQNDYWHLTANTLSLAAMGTLTLLVIASALLALRRITWIVRPAIDALQMGYAVPGAVLAVGTVMVLGVLTTTSHALGFDWYLTSGLFALIICYTIRFGALAIAPLQAGLLSIPPVLAEAAHNLRTSTPTIMWKIYVPLLTPSLFAAILLVFIEITKEMPATLLLRPFGWDTLAVRIFELTSEGEWERAAPTALILVSMGILPTALLYRNMHCRFSARHVRMPSEIQGRIER